MKKIMFVGAFALLALASCKKDYTCKCTTEVSGGSPSTNSYTITDHRSDAEASCKDGSASGGGVTKTCDLD